MKNNNVFCFKGALEEMKTLEERKKQKAGFIR